MVSTYFMILVANSAELAQDAGVGQPSRATRARLPAPAWITEVCDVAASSTELRGS